MHKRNSKNNFKYLNIMMFLMIISTIFALNATASRYIGTFTANDDIIAIPVLTLSNNEEEYQITDMIPGDIVTKEFYVSNKDNNNSNEVLLSYYFNIDIEKTASTPPLKIELLDENNNNLLSENSNTSTRVELSYNTSEEVIQKYKLKITWDSKDSNYTYAGQEISYKIVLQAEQI